MLILILILIILLIIIYYYYNRPITTTNTIINNVEGFEHGESTQGSKAFSTLRRPYRGVFNSRFNGRMAIDDQYYFDALFDDAIYYPNSYDQNYMLNDVIETGMQKCQRECSGNCVEFGVTNNATCFAY